MYLTHDIAKTLSKYYPYSPTEIYMELEKYKSVDLILDALEYSLKYYVSLKEACLRCRGNK